MRQLKPEEYYYSANMYFDLDSPDKAIIILNKAVQLYPNYVPIHRLRARIHRSLIQKSGIMEES